MRFAPRSTAEAPAPFRAGANGDARDGRRGRHPTVAVVDALQAALGADRARAEPLELALYARDAGAIEGRAVAVCFPRSADEVAIAVRTARAHGHPFLGRGSGTGLAGGATPVGDPVVIVTTHLNRVLEVDPVERVAWVEPGVLNLDLTRAVAHLGLHYAPDPSSQQACSIGGNVATNAGGPHCLLYGTTQAHVLAVEVVLPDGSRTMVGGLGPDQPGLDLRGVFVGSEGTMGIATRIAVRLMADPPALRTLLLDFTDVDAAAATVSGIIAAGIVPAALEMMDADITRMVEDFVGAGYPRDAAAVLLVEVDGLPAGVAHAVDTIGEVGRSLGARSVRVAADDHERALLWKGRKSAFGAIARMAPNYYLHDTVVPRTKLVDVLRGVYAIAEEQRLHIVNVFHAGDGNLHPLIVFDRREPGVLERVHAAGDAIIRLSLDAGGVLSGEHGIGLEKRDHMRDQFTDDDLAVQSWVRAAFDPDGMANPHKVLPAGSRCGDVQHVPDGVWV
jgi:glycolate oxidase